MKIRTWHGGRVDLLRPSRRTNCHGSSGTQGSAGRKPRMASIISAKRTASCGVLRRDDLRGSCLGRAGGQYPQLPPGVFGGVVIQDGCTVLPCGNVRSARPSVPCRRGTSSQIIHSIGLDGTARKVLPAGQNGPCRQVPISISRCLVMWRFRRRKLFHAASGVRRPAKDDGRSVGAAFSKVHVVHIVGRNRRERSGRHRLRGAHELSS